MTYLTQVTLDFASASRLGLRDCYDWHQAVWKAFPFRDSQPRDFLTRLEQRREGFRLLIASLTKPVRPEWCPDGAENWKTKAIPQTFFTRKWYSFQLCANPTKKVSKESPDGTRTKNGRRIPLTTREELTDWIKRKGEDGGFVVDQSTLRTFSRGREYFFKKGQAGLHSAIEFQGILAVRHADKFYESFSRGIGSAKAFGFGLLVLSPILEGQITREEKNETH